MGYVYLFFAFLGVLGVIAAVVDEAGRGAKAAVSSLRTEPTGNPVDVLPTCCRYDGEIFVVCQDCRNYATGNPDLDTDVFRAEKFFRYMGPLRYCGTIWADDWDTVCPSCDQLAAMNDRMFVYHP